MPYTYPRRSFLSDETEPKDDIDNLFEKLQPIEPPKSLIARILQSVSKLAQPKPPIPWDQLDALVVRNDEREPS